MSMNYLQIVKTALGMMPAVIEAVKAIEAAMPDGKGADKLAVVKTTLESAYDKASDAVGKFDQYWPVISTMVGAVVTGLNAAGIFKKKAAK